MLQLLNRECATADDILPRYERMASQLFQMDHDGAAMRGNAACRLEAASWRTLTTKK
ncbi:MAG TPA: hypothetical protein VEI57_16180 [Nitrospirota bacterium]|nr:hypothetical protein [Nitrospirota bacterium]